MINPIVEEDLRYVLEASVDWKRFAGKAVLISGAAGMLPSYMVETLLFAEREGAIPDLKVLALVRDAQKAKARFAHWDTRALEFFEQDVCDPLPEELQADFVVHAASPATPRTFLKLPVDTLLANTVGTANLLAVAQRSSAEAFLLFSSGAVYGLPVSNEPLMREDDYGVVDPLDARSCYAEGKRAAEALCKAWHRQHGVPTQIARISHTYGPGMDLQDGRVFADFVADIVAGRNIVLKSDGSAARPFCYVSDATRAFFTLLLKGVAGEAYNVGMDHEISVGALADLLVGLFPERGLRVVREVEATEGQSRQAGVFDLTKIGALGWKPAIDVAAGFRRTIRYFEGLK